jgi:23S rRNA (cytidine2498-2'-O)-methyltransferase
VLSIAVSDGVVLAGVVSRTDSGSPYPGGRPPDPAPSPARLAGSAELSRARRKLVEALDHLELGATLPRVWLDLGAFPGGMTAELSARGCRVHAVDLAEPTPTLLALPGVTYHRADIHAFVPTEPVDAIVCDANGPPLHAARTVARLAATLRAGAIVVHTIKLPRWSDWPELEPRVRATLAAAGLVALRIRHGHANRQELTLTARRA